MKPYHTCQIYVPASGQAGQDLQLYQWALRGALGFQRARWLSSRALDSDRTVPTAIAAGRSCQMLCITAATADTSTTDSRGVRTPLQRSQVYSEPAIAARGHFDARLVPVRPTFDGELGGG